MSSRSRAESWREALASGDASSLTSCALSATSSSIASCAACSAQNIMTCFATTSGACRETELKVLHRSLQNGNIMRSAFCVLFHWCTLQWVARIALDARGS